MKQGMNTNNVLLTNGCLCDKHLAHVKGIQHYAFSVFIFNNREELLLQQRSTNKYHSAGLWSNTCCSHPLFSEENKIRIIATQRLNEEMGIECHTINLFTVFSYKAYCKPLVENEIDYIFIGLSNSIPVLNVEEVSNFRYNTIDEICKEIEKYPFIYTSWLRLFLLKFKNELKLHLSKLRVYDKISLPPIFL
jgi:isopentenyl-diphosphate delta-isomerase